MKSEKLLNLAKKKVLKEIAFSILERTGTYSFFEERFQWYDYILDIIDTKFWKDPPEVKRKPAPKNVITINFVNKGIDDIRLNKILKSDEVIALLPSDLKGEEDIPIATMKLSPPIRNKILNYRETVSSLDVVVDDEVSFVRNLQSCECEHSEFCDPHHKHVITGDLRVVSNPKLRKLLTKGPNYQEPKTLNYSKCRKEISSSLGVAIDNFAAKFSVNKDDFTSWKNKILHLVDQRVKIIKETKMYLV